MKNFETVNVHDMFEIVGENVVQEILSDFSCPKNKGIEEYAKKNAIDFTKKNQAVTYLVLDEFSSLAGILHSHISRLISAVTFFQKHQKREHKDMLNLMSRKTRMLLLHF